MHLVKEQKQQQQIEREEKRHRERREIEREEKSDRERREDASGEKTDRERRESANLKSANSPAVAALSSSATINVVGHSRFMEKLLWKEQAK